MFTQFDALRVAHAHLTGMGKIVSARVGMLFPTTTAPLQLVKSDASMRACLTKMMLTHVRVCGVVDSDGVLVAVATASDIKALASMAAEDATTWLAGSVVDFLSLSATSAGTRRSLITRA